LENALKTLTDRSSAALVTIDSARKVHSSPIIPQSEGVSPTQFYDNTWNSENSTLPPDSAFVPALVPATLPEEESWKLDTPVSPYGTPPRNDPSKTSKPALHLAASVGNEKITRLLLDRGADTTKLDGNGKTVLHVAVEHQQEEIVHVLLDGQIDLNMKDSLGRTALFEAIKTGSDMIANLLLGTSLDIDAQDMFGGSAFHYAIETGSEAMVLLLLEHGADINA
jgi:hypothetical protein